ncbi:hypothetical protein ACOME3_009879 [Neoechinorhynchus agilis]
MGQWRDLNNCNLLQHFLTFDNHQSSNPVKAILSDAQRALISSNIQNAKKNCDRIGSPSLPTVSVRIPSISTAGPKDQATNTVIKYFGYDMDGSVQYPWKRTLGNQSELPLYINVETSEASWNHPEMVSLMESLSYFNEIRFCAYRTAIKLRAVQKRLCRKISIRILRSTQSTLVDLCDLQTVSATINSELLPNYKLNLNSTVSATRILTVLRRMYEAAAVAYPMSTINVPLATDLCLNWLLNLYDEYDNSLVEF